MVVLEAPSEPPISKPHRETSDLLRFAIGGHGSMFSVTRQVQRPIPAQAGGGKAAGRQVPRPARKDYAMC